MKTLKRTVLTLLIAFLSIVVSAVLITAIVDYRLVYPFHLIFSNTEEYPKMYVYAVNADQYANASTIESKHNMVLIITLQNYRNDLPEDEISLSLGQHFWRSNPRTWNYAEFIAYIESRELRIGVRLHKNSLVIIDGMTNETLLVHEITTEQTEQWTKDFWKRIYEPGFNVIEDASKVFAVPEEKLCWYLPPEDLNEVEIPAKNGGK